MKKKIIALVLAVITCMAVAMMAGCTHKFTCAICQKEVNEAGHKIKAGNEEVEICDDCNKKYEALKNAKDALGL